MSNPNSRKSLRLALLLAGATLLLWPALKSVFGVSDTVIVVCTAVLPAGSILRAADIGTASVPPSSVHPFQIPVADRSGISGRTVRYKLVPGQPLLWSDLEDDSTLNDSLANRIPGGRRAVALPLGPFDSYAGLLHPGDYVDVWWRENSHQQPQQLLNSVSLLALDRSLEGDAPGGPARLLTFAVEPAEALRLALLRDRGQWFFLLRNPNDVTVATASEGLRLLTSQKRSEPVLSTVQIIEGQ